MRVRLLVLAQDRHRHLGWAVMLRCLGPSPLRRVNELACTCVASEPPGGRKLSGADFQLQAWLGEASFASLST